jgi:hypothetical protein
MGNRKTSGMNNTGWRSATERAADAWERAHAPRDDSTNVQIVCDIRVLADSNIAEIALAIGFELGSRI